MKRKSRWTNDEIEILIKSYNNGETFEEINIKLPDRSLSSIKSKAFEIGLNQKSNKSWTNEEVDILTKLVLTDFHIQEDVLAEKIPTHTITDIKLKLKELNLLKYQKNQNANSIIGLRFCRLTVTYVVGVSNGFKIVHCRCDCGNEKDVKLNRLLSGELKSCGCYQKHTTSQIGRNNKKENQYDVESHEYGIGKTEDGTIFYFDKEDYELIKQYSWHTHEDNYIRTCYDTYVDENMERHNKYIMMHQLLSKTYFNDCMLDHINGKPFDNRKENLRVATQMQNAKNLKLSKANTSGHKGVYILSSGKYVASIQSDKIKYNLGTYDNYEDAVNIREMAENNLFKEFNREKEYL